GGRGRAGRRGGGRRGGGGGGDPALLGAARQDRPHGGGQGMPPPPAGSAPPVLVVDDDPEVRDFVCEVLAGAGFATATASDGDEVAEEARRVAPSLIILDVMMPRMDGYTTLTRLRGHPGTRDIPVIVLTGQGEPLYRTP